MTMLLVQIYIHTEHADLSACEIMLQKALGAWWPDSGIESILRSITCFFNLHLQDQHATQRKTKSCINLDCSPSQ